MNKVTQQKPSNGAITSSSPTNAFLKNPTFVYLETRTITKGQPLPWGINWAITYPTTLVFQGVRI